MRSFLVLVLSVALLVVMACGQDGTAATNGEGGTDGPRGSAPITLGAGQRPGLAVDAAGTAYIAWNGPESNVTTLRFCRLPRGAAGCDGGGASSIVTPGTSVSRPFVVVSGNRVVVVQHRYGADVPGFTSLYRYTSNDRGAVFGTGQVVGTIDFNEAVAGPGDTLSGVTESSACGMCSQNVVLDGAAPVDLEGRSTIPSALLSTERPYGGAIALLDAATPIAVFAAADGSQQFRRYTRSGSLNDPASWTPPVGVDAGLAYPKLSGGPAGLFMLGNVGRDIYVRKFDGTTFAPSLKIGAAFGVMQHLFQDAAARLHAVWHRAGSGGIELVHAVSDDGTSWRSGAVARQPGADDYDHPRVATAADHIGVAVWSSSDKHEIRVAPLGPDARCGDGSSC